LGKMLIVGERFRDASLLHDDKGGGVINDLW
jgi:hypothetical protein